MRPRINGEIKASGVRVIDDEGRELGVFAVADALELVASRREDLVEIEPDMFRRFVRLLIMEIPLQADSGRKEKMVVTPRSNRVAGRIDLPAPTPPDMRVRVRRARRLARHAA